jgi:hypothetical protein
VLVEMLYERKVRELVGFDEATFPENGPSDMVTSRTSRDESHH